MKIMENLTENSAYIMPNMIVNSLYSLSILSTQIILIALASRHKHRNFYNDLVVTIPISTISDKTGLNNKSRNQAKFLKQVHDELSNLCILVKNKNEKKYIKVLKSAVYTNKNNLFEIIFTPEFEKLAISFDDIHSTTLYDVDILLSIKSRHAYAIRLYEILCSTEYTCYSADSWDVEFNSLAELRFLLGIFNASANSNIKNELVRWKTDYERAETFIEKGNSHIRWGNFKDRVIEPSVGEINQYSDINVCYDPIRKDSAKVCGITFHVTRKSIESKYKLIQEMLQSDISENEVKSLIQTINLGKKYEIDKVS